MHGQGHQRGQRAHPRSRINTNSGIPGSHLPGGPPTPSSSQAVLLGSGAPPQGSMCIDMTPEVTARPSVKMKVLQGSSEPQLLLALSEAWRRPLGGHLRGQGLRLHCFRVASMRPGWAVLLQSGMGCRQPWSLSAGRH